MSAGCATEQPKFPDADAPAATTTPTPTTAAAIAGPITGNPPASSGGQPTQTNSTAGADTNLMSALDDKRQLSVGDKLSFRIVEDNDEPRELGVSDSGDIEVPYLGARSVLGMTCKQLALGIKKDLEARFYYHATVIISVDSMTRNLGRVYSAGALRAPGPLEIPGDEVFTVSKAVLRSGGFSDFADTHNVKVTRKSASGSPNQTFKVDVGQILEKGRTDLDLTLEPGDMIFVGERVIRF